MLPAFAAELDGRDPVAVWRSGICLETDQQADHVLLAGGGGEGQGRAPGSRHLRVHAPSLLEDSLGERQDIAELLLTPSVVRLRKQAQCREAGC